MQYERFIYLWREIIKLLLLSLILTTNLVTSHYSADIARQREELITWINKGGLLLSHDIMFRGCEAETIVYLTQRWGGVGGQVRSGPTRAVSQLCIVTSDKDIYPDEIKQHFNVIDEREDQGYI